MIAQPVEFVLFLSVVVAVRLLLIPHPVEFASVLPVAVVVHFAVCLLSATFPQHSPNRCSPTKAT
jgi:hypothetical protein